MRHLQITKINGGLNTKYFVLVSKGIPVMQTSKLTYFLTFILWGIAQLNFFITGLFSTHRPVADNTLYKFYV